MAIVRGTTVTGQGNGNISQAVDAGSSADRALFVSIVTFANVTISSATYGAVSYSAVDNLRNTRNAILIYFKAVATGSNTLTVTFSAGTHYGFAATPYSGVDGTTAIGTKNTATGSGTTPTVNVTSATGEVVVDVFSGQESGSGSIVAGANQSAQWSNLLIDGGWAEGGQSDEAGAATVTMSWTTPAIDWAIVAVPIKPAAAAATNWGRMLGGELNRLVRPIYD